MTHSQLPVAVIGAGPVGLAAAAHLASRGIEPVVFEAGESVRVAFSDSVELSGDNAGGVQFSINGRGGRLLGGSGEALAARLGRDDYPLFLSGR